MPEYVDKSICDDRYETVKDTNEKVNQIAVDIGSMKTAFEIHIKAHERNWIHTAKIIGLVITLIVGVAIVVVALSK